MKRFEYAVLQDRKQALSPRPRQLIGNKKAIALPILPEACEQYPNYPILHLTSCLPRLNHPEFINLK
ncbi:hypothetical protein [Andreprevotia chitinilytica]|uniref:hypothetical protein n=1 Tax=Andreprevotia chitinilytica TaxID=396808 RepID=UPI0012EBE1C0|nr:hypothetical protein [Andreprevotia chitinilytica]